MATGGLVTLHHGELDSGSPASIDYTLPSSRSGLVFINTDAGTVTITAKASLFADQFNVGFDDVSAIIGASDDLCGQSVTTTDTAAMWGKTRAQIYHFDISLSGASSANVEAVLLIEDNE